MYGVFKTKQRYLRLEVHPLIIVASRLRLSMCVFIAHDRDVLDVKFSPGMNVFLLEFLHVVPSFKFLLCVRPHNIKPN